MALTLAVTPAGRAAIRNATGDGTNAIRIASVGVSATAFAPGEALPDEIKRLATIVGGATAPDTIHVTINDAGTDIYTVRGFGFYLADGTLFASYGQSAVIVEKSAQSMMQLAVDVQFADIASADITFGDTNFNNPAATTERVGVVELATDAETAAGTDLQRVVTPKGLLAALNARLGAGAPSDFVKTLLTKATVLAFVTALGIRGAAQYDTGAGNGLDADLLDGKDGSFYLAWANLTGVPTSFPTTAHTHSADDITSGILPVVRGGTGLGTVSPGSYLVGNGVGALGSQTPAQVLANIGAAAKAHSHAQSDIIGLADALAAKAPLSSPALTGVPTAPTAATTTNSAQLATTAFVQSVIANVINGAPGALDTLKELADAMGDDPNFAATVTNALADRLSLSQGGTVSGATTFENASLTQKSSSTAATQLFLVNNSPGGHNWAMVSAGSTWGGGLPAGTLAFFDSTSGGTRFSIGPDGTAKFAGALNTVGPITSNQFINCTCPLTIMQTATGGLGGLMVSSTSSNQFSSAMMAFNRTGAFAAYFGISETNEFAVGGWSMGPRSYRVVHEGTANPQLNGTTYSTGGFQVGSSRALKTKFRKMRYGLDTVCAIETASYVYKKKYNADGRRRVGVVAEQIEAHMPEVVSLDAKGRKTVDYLQIVPALIESIKTLATMVRALHSRLSGVEKRRKDTERLIRALQTRVANLEAKQA